MSAALQSINVASAVNDPGIGSAVVLVDTASVSWNALDAVTFPASPSNLAQITVKDATGNAQVKPITINPNGQTLEGSTVLTTPYGSRSYVFSGSAWVVI